MTMARRPAPRLHVILARDQGEVRALSCDLAGLRRGAVALTALIVLLAVGTAGAAWLYGRTQVLERRIAGLEVELAHRTHRLSLDLDAAKQALLAERRARANEAAGYEARIAALQAETKRLFEESIRRLDERSQAIEMVMDHIGIPVSEEQDKAHSGGPLLTGPRQETDGQKLIEKTDAYLAILRALPLGSPLPGQRITSRYGYRRDPFVGKRAFHAGIDLRGRTGAPVAATAAGTVKRVGRNRGLGRYVIVDHGNGYETVFGHLSKQLVRRGQHVERGQTIGLVGSTGRSTGPHLHYEIRYQGRAIDPLRYLDPTRTAARHQGRKPGTRKKR